MTSQKKLDLVGTWSTIQKRAKRTPDIIVKTTAGYLYATNITNWTYDRATNCQTKFHPTYFVFSFYSFFVLLCSTALFLLLLHKIR